MNNNKHRRPNGNSNAAATLPEEVDNELGNELEVEPQNLLRVGITHGDTNGVGYELILKTFSDSAMFDICTPIVYGNAKIAAYHRKTLNLNVNLNNIISANEAEPGRLNLVNCFDDEVKIELGQMDAEAGKAAFLALEHAVSDLKAGRIDVLVTAPICKSAIHGAKFEFAGHTEYLGDRLGKEGEAPLMILANRLMRVALVTTDRKSVV